MHEFVANERMKSTMRYHAETTSFTAKFSVFNKPMILAARPAGILVVFRST